MTTTGHPPETTAWHALSPEAAAGRVGVDPDRGLDAGDAARRLVEHGHNQLPSDPAPSDMLTELDEDLNGHSTSIRHSKPPSPPSAHRAARNGPTRTNELRRALSGSAVTTGLRRRPHRRSGTPRARPASPGVPAPCAADRGE